MALREDLMVRMGLDKSRFQRGLKEAQSQGRSFAAGFLKSIAPLLGAAGLGGLTRAAINLGSKLSDLAIQLRVGVEELQVLKFLTQEAGLEFSILERAIRNANQRTQMAIDGNKIYSESLQRLNLNMREFAALPTEQKIQALAKAYMESGESLEAYTDVSQILGMRAGPAMLEVLQRLANDGFPAVEQAAKDAGQVMSEETTKKMDAAADSIERFRTRVVILSGEVLSKAMPAFDILRQTLGFIGESFGALIVNALNFGRTMGTIINAIIKPGTTAFSALVKVLGAVDAAFKGNFDTAGELAKQAKDEFLSVGDAIAEIPSKIAGAFKELVSDTKRNFKNLTDDVMKRGAEIVNAYNEMFPGDTNESEGPAPRPTPPNGATPEVADDVRNTPIRRGSANNAAVEEPSLDPSITSTDDPAEQARIKQRRADQAAKRRDPFGEDSFAKESLGRTGRFTNDMPDLAPSAIDRAFGGPEASAIDRAFTPPQDEGAAATEAGLEGDNDNSMKLLKAAEETAEATKSLKETAENLDNALSS